MRKLASVLVGSLVAISSAKASLVVLIPAKGATAVCADRRFVATSGKQFDSDGKLQLLPPNAVFFVVGLEAIFAGGEVSYAPGTIFKRFLAERAEEGIPSDAAMRDSSKLAQYLRDGFEKFLRANQVPAPKPSFVEIEPAFTLGILRTENHLPHLTTINVSRNAKKPSTAISQVSNRMERFGVDSQWQGSIFSRSDPMYVGQMQVVLGILQHDRQLSRFAADPYVKKFLLADFGMPLTDTDTALNAARRLISITAEGLTTLPSMVPGVSKESVCAVLDYSNETARYR
jgi:hypothetical protein